MLGECVGAVGGGMNTDRLAASIWTLRRVGGTRGRGRPTDPSVHRAPKFGPGKINAAPLPPKEC